MIDLRLEISLVVCKSSKKVSVLALEEDRLNIGKDTTYFSWSAITNLALEVSVTRCCEVPEGCSVPVRLALNVVASPASLLGMYGFRNSFKSSSCTLTCERIASMISDKPNPGL